MVHGNLERGTSDATSQKAYSIWLADLAKEQREGLSPLSRLSRFEIDSMQRFVARNERKEKVDDLAQLHSSDVSQLKKLQIEEEKKRRDDNKPPPDPKYSWMEPDEPTKKYGPTPRVLEVHQNKRLFRRNRPGKAATTQERNPYGRDPSLAKQVSAKKA